MPECRHGSTGSLGRSHARGTGAPCKCSADESDRKSVDAMAGDEEKERVLDAMADDEEKAESVGWKEVPIGPHLRAYTIHLNPNHHLSQIVAAYSAARGSRMRTSGVPTAASTNLNQNAIQQSQSRVSLSDRSC